MLSSLEAFVIALLPGDGIGGEVADAGVAVLDDLCRMTPGLAIEWRRLAGGARHYLETGTAFPDESMKALETCDAILFGAMGLPHVRYPNGTEIAPQLDIREHFELYAGVRPTRVMPSMRNVLSDPRASAIDFVIVREQTEGFFYSRGKQDIDAKGANDHSRLTRGGCERVFDFAFRLARKRAKGTDHVLTGPTGSAWRGGKTWSVPKRGRVTCVDKSNVLTSMAYMRRIFDERAKQNADIVSDQCYVDAMALNLVRQPWEYDVIVTENLLGDILSDLAAGLVGGMGLAPSADIGDAHAMFQPAHGSAPDIMGRGIANPTAMLLSCAMMLDWLGERHGHLPATDAAQALEGAVFDAYAVGRVKPFEFGGSDGTAAVTRAVLDMLTTP